MGPFKLGSRLRAVQAKHSRDLDSLSKFRKGAFCVGMSL
jgi:hypothetical protein